jgi:itaconyl-CoA hydratase
MPVQDGWQGRFFDDFKVGDVYRSRLGRTITEADNISFTLLTNNTNQVHFNRVYAANADLPDCLVNSALTLSVVAGLTVTDVSENGINLGWTDIELPAPVYPGDTLWAQTEVLETRESKSRPHMGIVTVRTEGIKQDGSCVLRYTRSILVWKRAHAPSRDSFPTSNDGGRSQPILHRGDDTTGGST